MEKPSAAQKTLCALLAKSLFGRPFAADGSIDWAAIMNEAQAQAVLPLAHAAAKELLPPETEQRLAAAAENLLIHNMQREWEHAELHELLSAAGIPYTVMKGSASAAYYPEPMLRTMGDVDFLVAPEQVEAAGAALEAAGFVPTAERNENPIHRAYLRRSDEGESEWELHWQPNGIPGGEAGERLRALMADSIETARLRKTEMGAYYVPDDRHHGLMILIHTVTHLLNLGVGLRHLCDWAAFVGSMDEAAFRALLEEPLRDCGLWETARLLTALCVRDLGCPGHDWALKAEEDALLNGLLCDILAGGNFGRKDRERINQAKLLLNRDSGAPEAGNMAGNLIAALNVKTRRSLPITAAHPALLPVGWAYVGARHLWRSATGRRPKLDLKKMTQGAAERGELYAALHLFECEAD